MESSANHNTHLLKQEEYSMDDFLQKKRTCEDIYQNREFKRTLLCGILIFGYWGLFVISLALTLYYAPYNNSGVYSTQFIAYFALFLVIATPLPVGFLLLIVYAVYSSVPHYVSY